MNSTLSLRARVLVGGVLWTVGLFVGVVLVSTLLLLTVPRYPIILHHSAFKFSLPLSAIALTLMVVGMIAVHRGLSSIKRLRERLASVHGGAAARVEGTYPSEVQPLVEDLNTLLAHQEEMVGRALRKAGDLAHGLKTPLAVLAHEADMAEAAGHRELAGTLRQQVERMRRQIEYHLAHARAAASGATPGARTVVLPSAEGLVRTLERLHASRGIAITLDVDPAHAVRAGREDLEEMLGNLLDNACKWARSRARLSSALDNGTVTFLVDDDGPGLAASMREAVLQRGVRADEAAPGSGLGLAIVRELAELYGGRISLDGSPDGGVRARLQLPRGN